MNYDSKLNRFQRRDGAVTEIAIIFLMFVLMVFGAAVYYFYVKVTDLAEETRALTSRMSVLEMELESRVESPPAETPSNATSTLEPQIDREWIDDLSGNVGKLSVSPQDLETPVVTPKAVGTVKVMPDGTILEPTVGVGSGTVDTSQEIYSPSQ
ncbi:MAG: hypothetical protein K5905_25450 [Roseibium sp.]|uniref:hypothetical protein n=1 Tax=Roseibium sp. TaxID=1936156 RepID=UPI00262F9990|nr:hypothetical protein [Roseibium sp.]MCV0428814.1 hypothetical protein [Roseibium sp.]